jgi:hypothetical protein
MALAGENDQLYHPGHDVTPSPQMAKTPVRLHCWFFRPHCTAHSDPTVFVLRSPWCLLDPPCALQSFWCLSRSPRVSSGALEPVWMDLRSPSSSGKLPRLSVLHCVGVGTLTLTSGLRVVMGRLSWEGKEMAKRIENFSAPRVLENCGNTVYGTCRPGYYADAGYHLPTVLSVLNSDQWRSPLPQSRVTKVLS